MNYFKHYTKLIRRAQSRVPPIPHEWHHIIPKCLGKLRNKPKSIWDASYNKVYLTPREHFIAHLLLTKIFKNKIYKQKMIFGMLMFYKSNEYQQRKLTAKQYSSLRIKHSENLMGENNTFFNKKHTQETKDLISKKKLGIPSPKTTKAGYAKFLYVITFHNNQIVTTTSLREYGEQNGIKLNLYRFTKPNPPKSKTILSISKNAL